METQDIVSRKTAEIIQKIEDQNEEREGGRGGLMGKAGGLMKNVFGMWKINVCLISFVNQYFIILG